MNNEFDKLSLNRDIGQVSILSVSCIEMARAKAVASNHRVALRFDPLKSGEISPLYEENTTSAAPQTLPEDLPLEISSNRSTFHKNTHLVDSG